MTHDTLGLSSRQPTRGASPRAIIVLAGTLALAGCSAYDPPETTDTLDDPIVGGVPDAGDPAVAALLYFDPNQRLQFLCSATLVSPTVLLTAAHCVFPVTGNNRP